MANNPVHRVLITGASGLLGRALMKQFTSSNAWEVLGLAYSRVSGNLKKANLLDFDQMRQIVEDFKPNILVHSAAERRPDFAESNQSTTDKLNVGSTKYLAQLVEDLNQDLQKPQHFLLYISSNYVFDGTKKSPYKPDDTTNPLNKYGQSKLDGEIAVKKAHPSGVILRVPVFYGDVENLLESSISSLVDVIKQTSQPTAVDDYRPRYPTLVDNVAGIVEFLTNTKLHNTTFSGVFHWSGDEQMTKYGMVCKIAEVFDLPITHISANQNPEAGPQNRPFHSALHVEYWKNC